MWLLCSTSPNCAQTLFSDLTELVLLNEPDHGGLQEPKITSVTEQCIHADTVWYIVKTKEMSARQECNVM
jgi:hypothetical protein